VDGLQRVHRERVTTTPITRTEATEVTAPPNL